MKPCITLLAAAVVVGCPLVFAADPVAKAGKARFGLDRWTYMNGDGRVDVVATDSEHVDSGIFWFEAPADPTAGEWVRHDIEKGYNGLDSLSVADMNEDGRPDIVVGETKDRLRTVIYENVDGGKSWNKHQIDEGKESHKGAQAVDLNGDGRFDIVSIAYFGYKDLHVWRNDNGGAPAAKRN